MKNRLFLSCFLLFASTSFGQSVLNDTLSKQLEKILADDQKYRADLDNAKDTAEYTTVMKRMIVQDSINTEKVCIILDKNGWLGSEVVGEEGALALWSVIQHADLPVQEKYLSMMRAAVKEKKLAARRFALTEDRMEMRYGRSQIYGSQLMENGITHEATLAPLSNPDGVDKRRSEAGLPPLAEYLATFDVKWNLEQYKKDLPSIKANCWPLPHYQWDSLIPVGTIAYDAHYDNPAFKVTDTLQVFGIRKPIYKGGKPVLISYFKERYKNGRDSTENGYVVVHFFVNDKGKAGKFRIQIMDFDYQPIRFVDNLETQIFCLTKQMSGWQSIKYGEKNFGYYCYLNFKIINGQIEDIMP